MTTLTKKYRTFVPATGELPDPLYDYQQSITYHYNNDAAEYDTADKTVFLMIGIGVAYYELR